MAVEAQEVEIARTFFARAERDPVWFIENVLGLQLWDKQREIAEAVRDHHKVAVRACHASGKTVLAAALLLWWLYTFKDSLVVSVAPTKRQVEMALWSWVRKLHSQARVPLGGEVLRTQVRLRDGWFAIGFSPDSPEALQGLHAPDILVIADESVGIDRPLWDAFDGLLTSSHARLLAIGNPTSTQCYFYEMFKDPNVHKIGISAYDVPNVKEQRVVVPGLVEWHWVEEKRKRWGESSPLYQARVLGEFPENADDSLIRLNWIEAAQQRTLDEVPDGDPVILGCDIARYGSSETVLMLRRGDRARLYKTFRAQDTEVTTGQIVRAMVETGAVAHIDATGIGAAVYDALKHQGKQVVAIEVARAASDASRFLNLRAEYYWKLRLRFESGQIAIDSDEDLAVQLASIRYTVNRGGKLQIESKEEMRARGLPSPDRADALMLAFAEGNTLHPGPLDLTLVEEFGYRPSPWRV